MQILLDNLIDTIKYISQIRKMAQEDPKFGFEYDDATFAQVMSLLTPQSYGNRFCNKISYDLGIYKSDNQDAGDAQTISGLNLEIKCSIISNTNLIRLNMKYRYINCSHCSYRDIESRYTYPCDQCKNTGQMIDPNVVLCNLCGEDLTVKHPTKTIEEQAGVTCNISGGYNSLYLVDGISYSFNFCDKCIRNMFDTFKILPSVSAPYMDTESGNEYTYQLDREIFLFNEFKASGKQHQKYLESKCNVVYNCDNKAIYSILRINGEEISDICCCLEHRYSNSDSNSYSPYYYKYVPFIPDHLKAFI